MHIYLLFLVLAIAWALKGFLHPVPTLSWIEFVERSSLGPIPGWVMVAAGIIDPAKVTRGALENAASIAAMILTTEALVTDKPEKDRPSAAPQMPEY